MFKLNVTPDEVKTLDIRKTPYSIAERAIHHVWKLMTNNCMQDLEQYGLMDPCCGTGTFIDAMLNLNGTFSEIEGYELNESVYAWLKRKYSDDHNVDINHEDFLSLPGDEYWHIIAGEPPRHLITQFIDASLKHLFNSTHAFIAFVVPITYDASAYNVVDSYTNDFDEDGNDTKTIFITK